MVKHGGACSCIGKGGGRSLLTWLSFREEQQVTVFFNTPHEVVQQRWEDAASLVPGNVRREVSVITCALPHSCIQFCPQTADFFKECS